MRMWIATAPTWIEATEVIRCTKTKVHYIKFGGLERSAQRIGKYCAYFEIWADAKNWLLDKANERMGICREEIYYLDGVIDAIEELKESNG